MGARAKHLPMRRCIVCRASRPKPMLIRWVRTASGIALDNSGKAAGRGAYICRAEPCLRAALTGRRFERILGGQLPVSEVESLLAACESSRAGDGSAR
jgi:predicted RNA-binding protein YlxR (DUF448 family)